MKHPFPSGPAGRSRSGTVRRLVRLLLPGALLLLAACGPQEKKAGLAIYNQNDPFIDTFTHQIRTLSALENFTLMDPYNGQNSQMIQNEQIEDMMNQNPDLLIINPVDRLAVYPVIRNLKKQEIPVIFFNREPLRQDLDLWDKAFYVGARAAQSGRLQGELLIQLFGGDPGHLNRYDRNGDNRIQAVILKGEQGHQDAEIRTSEVVRTFEERGFRLEILLTEVANWNQEQAFEKMEAILQNWGDRIEAVLSNNDAMAIGAINRMKSEGWFADSNNNGMVDPLDEKWIPVVGIDGLDEAVEYINRGYLYGTVLNDSREQARAIVELTALLLENRPLSALSFPLEEGKYIWIDYKVFHSD